MGDKFDEILAKSQRLTTQLGIDDEATIFSQPLRRGINELESSRNIGIGTKRYFEEKDKLNAVRLLAQKNFDAVKLSSEVHDIAVETPYDPTERLEGVDLDGYLAHHHDMIVLNAIDDTNRITEDYVKYTQRKRLVDEWQVIRRMYIESLGNVTQHWSKKPSATATGAGTGGVKLPIPQSQLGATTGKQPTTTNATMSADVSQLSDIIQKQSNVIHNLHSSVKLLNTATSATFGSTFDTAVTRIAPLTQLAECITIPVATTNLTLTDANGLTRTDLIGYKSVLEMMAEMVGETVFDIVPSGLFSPLCFGSGSGISGGGSSKNIAQTLLPSIQEKKQFLSLGAKSYLERQQLKTVTLDIDDNIQKGFIEQYGVSTGVPGTGGGRDMMTGGSGREGVTRKQRLKSFIYHLYRTGYLYTDEIDTRYIAMTSSSSCTSSVTNVDVNIGSQYRGNMMNLSRGTADNTSGSGKMIPVWPFIYYCLTGGDIAVAIDELKSCLEKGVRYVESDIVVVLQYFQYFIYKFTTLSQQTQKQSASATAAGTTADIATSTTDYVSKAISSLMTGATTSGGSGNSDNSISNSILTPAQSQEFYDALANCKELYEREVNDYNLIHTSSTGSGGSGDGSGSSTGREGTAGASSTSTSLSVVDPYRLFVLNLVSLSDKTALSDPGIATQSYTLQNYLWANIWFIVYERYTAVALYGMTALSSGSASGGGSDKVFDIGENWLYNAVLDYGGDSHFDPAQNNPLKYVTVLLVCHRFGDAIRHLWHTSKTLPAVHLAVTCLHYGLILPHLPLNQNPIFRHLSTMRNSTVDFTTVGSNSNNNLSEELSPSAMLQFFFNRQFQVLFPEIAVDYFLCLNSNWLPFIQQVVITATNTLTGTSQLNRGSSSGSRSIDDTILSAFIDSHVLRSRGIISSVFESLLINTAYEKNTLVRLVGEPQTAINEKLNVGYLHDCLDRDMVNLLLIRCAYVFLSVKQEVGNAVSFYCLSGRLMDALEELCVQLSRVVIIPNAVIDIVTSINTASSSGSGGIVDQSQSSLLSTQSSSQKRTYWITQCVQFYDAYVNTGVGPLFTCLQQQMSSDTTSNNISDLIPTFLLLLNLSLFINAACVSKNNLEAVVLLEEITILPSNNDQLKSCVVMINSGSISNDIMSILDDILLIAMHVLIQSLLLYQQEPIASVLLTLQQQNELRMKMELIRERIHTLVVFTNNISTRLNRVDTQRIISRMEMNINQQLNIIQRQQQLFIMQ